MPSFLIFIAHFFKFVLLKKFFLKSVVFFASENHYYIYDTKGRKTHEKKITHIHFGMPCTEHSAQEVYAAGVDQTLQAIRKQLGTKVESQQQLYQPDQTTLSGNFAQLQAVAESLVSRLQTVPLSDETTKKIQQLALSDAKNSVGVQEDGKTEVANTSALSRKDRLSMIQEEVQKFAPSKRAAALNTINKVWGNEMDRIGAYIKERDPNWTIWGDKFDTSILDDYKPGVNMWV